MVAITDPTPRRGLQLDAETVARETRRAVEQQAAIVGWRRHLKLLLAAMFGSQMVATFVGVLGFATSDEAIGHLLLKAGQVGVVAFPFLIGVLWVMEADRRGDL